MRQVVRVHQFSLCAVKPPNVSATKFLVHPQDVLDAIRDGAQMTDHADDPSAGRAALKLLEGLVERVRVQRPEALVKEEG